MKIGIFGGTFSPPHTTHISMATSAIKQLHLDKLHVLPCGAPPHKTTEVTKEHRLAMTQLAFGDVDGAVIDTYEMEQNGNSYSYLTLAHYKDIYPTAQLYFIIGGDSLRDFCTWRNPEKICQLATIAVCNRADMDLSAQKQNLVNLYGAKIVEVSISQSDISSTAIRVDCQFMRKNATLTPAVYNYITTNKLYGEFSPMVEQLSHAILPYRFTHTYYVTKRAMEYKEELPFNKVFVACLLHDCAKYITPEQWHKYGFTNPNNLHEKIVHAELGRIVAQTDYGITDKEILDAIEYHTTARANATKLDKLVYVADKTAANRQYPVAHLLAPTLEETFIRVLTETRDMYPKERCTQNQLNAFSQYLEE